MSWARKFYTSVPLFKNNKMAAEEDEVDIEGIGEGDDLVDYKDMMENTDVIN